MSVVKLLSRIDAPDTTQGESTNGKDNVHDHTYGIKDPLTQFALLLSALVSRMQVQRLFRPRTHPS